MGSAKSLFDQGIGNQIYTGSTVIPYAGQTIAGMDRLETVAGNASPAFDDNFQRVANNASYGGLNPLQQSAVDRLQPMVAGEMLARNNPFTEAIVDRAAERMASSVGEMAAGAGRYGSGAHQGVLAREIGDMANQAYAADYNRERSFMQDAIGSLYNAGQQQQSNVNASSAALTNALTAQQAPSDMLMGVGSMYEDLATRQMNDELRIFEASQNRPWEQVARLNAIASGAGSLGGTSTTAQPVAAGPSAFQRGLSGAVKAAPLGLPGVLIGGLGSALFG